VGKLNFKIIDLDSFLKRKLRKDQVVPKQIQIY